MSISEYYQQLSGDRWGISYPHYPIYSPRPNPTERAYQIIKKLVELKTIPEPDSYKKFCELIDAIAKVL